MKYIEEESKYEGFSLIEMLITIVIIGMVILISSVTLTSLIKVSTVSSNKIRARNESEFVLELVRRTVRNSDPSDVYIFNSLGDRKFDYKNNIIDSSGGDLDTAYEPLGENDPGNEIHFRPYGYKDWICLAYFESSTEEGKGYILRTSAQDLMDQHENCFGSPEYVMVLNSDYVDVNLFEIAYTVANDSNYIIRFDIESEPVDWYLADGAPIKPKVIRQGIVSTEGLIW